MTNDANSTVTDNEMRDAIIAWHNARTTLCDHYKNGDLKQSAIDKWTALANAEDQLRQLAVKIKS